MSGKEIDLSMFCATENSNFTMTQVFVRGGYKCATDGRIGVRIKCDDRDTDGNFPKIEVAFGAEFKGIEPIKIAEPSMDVETRCEMCEGGKEFYDLRECEGCGGGGKCECPCPTTHNCGKCGGDGSIYHNSRVCIYCDGRERSYFEVKIAGYVYKGHYMKLAFRYLSNLTAVGIGEGGMLLLTFDGGQCVLMPFLETGI